jgi:hypothetical protein
MSIKNKVTLFTLGILTGIASYKTYKKIIELNEIELLSINTPQSIDDNSQGKEDINTNVSKKYIIDDKIFFDMTAEINSINDNDFSENIKHLWNPNGKNMILSIINYMLLQYENGRMKYVIEEYISNHNIAYTEEEIKKVLYHILFKYITFFQLINLAYDGDVDSIGLNKYNIPTEVLLPIKQYLLSLPDFNNENPNFSNIETCISEHNLFENQFINIIDSFFLI